MYAAIRIRGNVDISSQIKDTLKIMRLTKTNHLVLIKENKESKGMAEKVRSYLTYGEIDKETLKKLLIKRGRLTGDKRVTEAFLKEKGAKSIDAVVDALEQGKSPKEFGIKPVFRLSPPRKGFERAGIKKTFKEGGVLGYRGKEINKLILKMI